MTTVRLNRRRVTKPGRIIRERVKTKHNAAPTFEFHGYKA